MIAATNGAHGAIPWALDPDLSFLASRAAIELDNLLLGKGNTIDAVVQLAEFLRDSTESTPGAGPSVNLIDPEVIEVVSRAIDASGEQSVKTLEDLHVHAGRLARELRGSKDDSDQARIERLRSFCVALSQVATAHRQAELDMEPSHPYRS